MSREKIRFGIIGVGYLGSLHCRILTEIKEVNFVGVYDTDEERKNKIASIYKVKAFESEEELIDNVDAVICAVPTKHHYRVGIKVLEKNRHVFIEKPISETIEQGEKLVKLAREKNLKLMVGHVERFNPAIISSEKYIDQPFYIETLRIAPFNPRGTDVDVVRDLMIHDLDIALNYIKSEPIFVHAVGAPVLTNKIDIASARVEFSNGAIINLTVSRASLKKVREIRIFQRDRYISINLLSKESYMIVKEDDAILPYFIEVDEHLEPLKLEVQEFVNSIIENREPRVSGEDGLKALKIALLIIQDIERRISRLDVSTKG
ncbi:MAG: Gfo/Idh/MocA family oxidoreductase [candidate division WOR-3 bacterium]|nr:Gfo/Idh/MocA family oxidoreductase [candidate division WOR-3 bacterium]MDW8150860.1 Gfo/Idh/MocA family oxidoreductase [candidate division WOR-3 bacterium]